MSLVITIRTEAAVFTSSRFSFLVVLIFLVRLPKDFHCPDLSLIRLYRIASQLLPHNVLYYGFTKDLLRNPQRTCTAVHYCSVLQYNAVVSISFRISPYWSRLQKPLIFCVFDGVWQSTEDENQKSGSVDSFLWLQSAHKPNESIRELISAPGRCEDATVNRDDVRRELHFHPHRVVFLRETSQASPHCVRLSPSGS